MLNFTCHVTSLLPHWQSLTRGPLWVNCGDHNIWSKDPSPMNNWQEEYLNIKSSLLKWSKHPKRAIIVLSLMYLFIPLRAKRVRRKQILLNEYQYTPFSAGNNYPDLHHLQGVLNLPNKFHLYVIICYWFIVIKTIKNPSSN